MPPFHGQVTSHSLFSVSRTAIYVPFNEATVQVALSLTFPLFSLGWEQVMSPGALKKSELLLGLSGRLCCSYGANLGFGDVGFQGESGQPGPHQPGTPKCQGPKAGQGEEHQPVLTALRLTPLMGKRSGARLGWQRHRCFGETVTRNS